eukprot:TRINITY_DN8878_c0_g1_i1.p1 TRINITY_DN8878_c0_g1~~TRINITY_DN8878_c0_g1_i1.p1  ORF type:complete len:272 (-),score=62.81 TRINITY_DN8878_c0_g1_i1:26-781(-)
MSDKDLKANEAPKAKKKDKPIVPAKLKIQPGSQKKYGDAADAAAAQAVRSALRQLPEVFEAYDKLVDEASSLSQAMQSVAEKIRLVARSEQEPGPVHVALSKHEGAQERMVAILIARLEQFRSESILAHGKFQRQHGNALLQCIGSVGIWLLRKDLGSGCVQHSVLEEAEGDDGMEDPFLSAQRLQETLSVVEAELTSWKDGLESCRYLSPPGGLPTSLPIAPQRIDSKAALRYSEALLEACAKHRFASDG